MTAPCHQRSKVNVICYHFVDLYQSLNLSIAVLQRSCCWNITLCCDLDYCPLTLNIYSIGLPAVPLLNSTKFERNRAIRGRVIAISIFDLEHDTCCAYIWDNFHQVWTRLNYPFLTLLLIRYVTLWPWSLTHWPWKFVLQIVSRDQSLRNLSESEQSPAELLVIDYLAMFSCYVTLCPQNYTDILKPALTDLHKIWRGQCPIITTHQVQETRDAQIWQSLSEAKNPLSAVFDLTGSEFQNSHVCGMSQRSSLQNSTRILSYWRLSKAFCRL